MKEKLLIFGAGGHSMCLIDIVKRENKYDIVGVIGHENENKDTFMGYPVYKGDKYLQLFLSQGIESIVIGIGGFTNNIRRKQVFNEVKAAGFKVVSIIDPSAVISEYVQIGEGVVIFPGVVILAQVSLGDNVIVATSSSIAHETTIGDHVLISAGVTIGANSNIGEGVLFALGSKSISGVNVGENALIAAGAVVVSNVEPNSKVFGIPAKKRQEC